MALPVELVRLLQQQPLLWRGDEHVGVVPATVPTGYAELDASLPGGGWPLGALTEILVPQWGIGEISLLLPALASRSAAGLRLAWISPPYKPYAPALLAGGIDLRRIVLIDAGMAPADWSWAMEKLLRHPAVGVVLAWPRRTERAELRRLQLAAEAGGTMGVLLLCRSETTTPAALRLELRVPDAAPSTPPVDPTAPPIPPRRLEVLIHKARGSWSRRRLILTL